MLYCANCGEVFEELYHYTMPLTKDDFYGCPRCGAVGGFREISNCSGCGEVFDEEDLYSGFCEDCLRKFCTYDMALDFLKSADLLGKFFCWLLNDQYEPGRFATPLLEAFEELYLRRKANDLLTGSTDFLDMVQQYILEADGCFGQLAFGLFLSQKNGGGGVA